MNMAQDKRALRREAAARGHDLGRWRAGVALASADCKRCGATMFVDGLAARSSGVTVTNCPGDTLADDLREALESRVIFTRTDYASGGTAAYVRLFLFDRDDYRELTWQVARLLDKGTHEGRGLRRGGYGYNRALDVLSAVAHKVGATLDQGRWREMP